MHRSSKCVVISLRDATISHTFVMSVVDLICIGDGGNLFGGNLNWWQSQLATTQRQAKCSGSALSSVSQPSPLFLSQRCFIYICMPKDAHVHTKTHTHMNTHIQVNTHMNTHTYRSSCSPICTLSKVLYTYACLRTRMCTQRHTHMNTHTHTHTHIQLELMFTELQVEQGSVYI